MKAVNLLPSDLRGAGKPASAAVAPSAGGAGRVGAFAVLGVLAFGVVALAAYVLTNNTVKDRQAQLAQVTAQSAAVTQRAAQLKPYADFQTAAMSRIQTVKDLADSRFDWEQALRDLSRAIPANVSLTGINGSVSASTTGGGSGSDPLRAAIGSPAISLQGCTSGQTSVADLMARLRAVRGVTRVALSKSEKPDSVPATTTTTGVTRIACRGKRPPTFSLVMFFEHSTVPATVQDVTVAADGTSGQPATTTATSAATGAATTTPATGTTATPASTPAPTPANG
jgi:Tfp pilus assembly protein PilN